MDFAGLWALFFFFFSFLGWPTLFFSCICPQHPERLVSVSSTTSCPSRWVRKDQVSMQTAFGKTKQEKRITPWCTLMWTKRANPIQLGTFQSSIGRLVGQARHSSASVYLFFAATCQAFLFLLAALTQAFWTKERISEVLERSEINQ